MATRHPVSYVCLVCISYSDQLNYEEMFRINHTNLFSIHANVCVQKSLNHTSYATVKLDKLTTVFRSVLQGDGKYYPKVSLDDK